MVIIPDKTLIRQRFCKASKHYDQHAIAQQKINQQLLKLLLTYGGKHFKQVLELGCGTGLLSQLIQQYIYAEQWYFNDLYDTRKHLSYKLKQTNWQFLEGDMEQLTFPRSCDLIISASAIQWINDKQTFLQNCLHSLNISGMLLLSTFAPDNLHEIRQLTGISLHYPSIQQWQDWLSQDFEIITCNSHAIRLLFEDPIQVLKHLKYTGVTALQKTVWQRQQLHAFSQHYQANYTYDNRQVQLTYMPLFIVAKRKK